MPLEQRDKELAAIGASIGANCRPCIEHHLGAGHEAGLSQAELDDAVATAYELRRGAVELLVVCEEDGPHSALAELPFYAIPAELPGDAAVPPVGRGGSLEPAGRGVRGDGGVVRGVRFGRWGHGTAIVTHRRRGTSRVGFAR